MKALLFTIFVLTGLQAAAQPVAGNEPVAFNALLSRADQFYQQARYDSATSILEKTVQLSRLQKAKKYEAEAIDKLADIVQIQGRYADMRRYDSILLPLAYQLKDTTTLISVYNRTGVYYQEKGKAKEAEQSYRQALGFGLEKQQSAKTAEVYSNLGSIFLSTGDKEKAMDWFINALKLYEINKHEKGQGETYSNISSVYYLMGKTDDAIEYQKKSIVLREKNNDRNGLVVTNVNIGQLYILKNDYPQSLKHLQSAVSYAEELKVPRLMATAYSGMTAYASRTKNFPDALMWQTKAIKIFEELDNRQLLSRLYVSAGNLANATNDSAAAAGFYTRALALSKEMNNKENIGNAYEKMSSFYLSRKDFAAAYDNYKNFILYRDSVSASSTLSKIEEVRTKYETEKKDGEISRLNTLQRLKELEIEKQNAVIAGNLLVAKQKQNEIDLLSKSQELQDAKISQQEEELEKKELLATARAQQLEIAEKEKQLQDKQISNQRLVRNLLIGGIVLLLLLGYTFFNRYQLKKKLEQQKSLLGMRNSISQDLHDDIGASLSNINILTELAKRNISEPEKSAGYLNKASEDIQRISESLSDIVWNINPRYDDLENLFVRMRRYAADMLDGKNIQGEFDFPASGTGVNLSMTQRRDLYLVFKEAVNNLVKYSGATHATVKVTTTGSDMQLLVKDNGKGFEHSAVKTGNGLLNMEQRAVAAGGVLTIQSSPGSGTIVEMRIKTS